jgi:hypothetical protein
MVLLFAKWQKARSKNRRDEEQEMQKEMINGHYEGRTRDLGVISTTL